MEKCKEKKGLTVDGSAFGEKKIFSCLFLPALSGNLLSYRLPCFMREDPTLLV